MGQTQIEIACGYCNRKFFVSPKDYRKRMKANASGIYCGYTCGRKALRAKGLCAKAPMVTLQCSWCAKPFQIKKAVAYHRAVASKSKLRFCSRSCSGSFTLRPENQAAYRRMKLPAGVQHANA